MKTYKVWFELYATVGIVKFAIEMRAECINDMLIAAGKIAVSLGATFDYEYEEK